MTNKNDNSPTALCEYIELSLEHRCDPEAADSLKPLTWGEVHSRIDAAANADPDFMRCPVDLTDLDTRDLLTLVNAEEDICETRLAFGVIVYQINRSG